MQTRSKINSPSPSRRGFLRSAASIGGAALLGSSWLRATGEEGDLRVASAVTAQTISIDMHNHVYPPGTEPHPRAASGSGPPNAEQDTGATPSLAEAIERSGLSAVCASFVLDFAANQKPGDAQKNLLRWLSAIDAELERGHIRRALTLKDLKLAHQHGKPTIVQTVEGAMFLEGELERVEEVYRRGLRHLQLLHISDDMVAPLGDVNTVAQHLGGLTAFGAQIIKECNRLGVVVDLAHASHETVVAALKIARQPLLISHTNLDTWTGKDPRMAQRVAPLLISKEHAKVVADAGGIVGVWTHLANSPQEFVASIRAMADAIGVDHVGIGTDTDLLSSRVGAGTNFAWPGVTQGFFPVVVEEMLRQGFTADEVGQIGGGNYCRLFGKVTGHG